MTGPLVTAARLGILLILICAGAGAGVETTFAADPKEPVAKVNDDVITMGDLEGLYRAQYELTPEDQIKENDPTVVERMSQVLEGLIERTLLDQEVKKRNTVAPPEEVDAQLKMFMERFPSREAFDKMLDELGLAEEDLRESFAERVRRRQLLREEVDAHITVSDEEIVAQYEGHKDVYVVPERVRARHILIAVPPDANPDQELFARERAQQVLKRALAGDDFGSLAEKFSQDESTRTKGGDIGYFFKGSLPEGLKEVAEAAFKLQPGEIGDLVKTSFGYHVVMVEDRKPAEQSTLEDARPGVEADVHWLKWSERYKGFIASLRGKAQVEIYYPPQ